MRADWCRYGRSAGPIRNRLLLELALEETKAHNEVAEAFSQNAKHGLSHARVPPSFRLHPWSDEARAQERPYTGCQDRGLIRNPVTEQFDSSESAHRRHLDQCIIHGWIAEAIPLLQQINPQHHFQHVRRATALGAGFGVVGLDQVDQHLPWHNGLHLRQKSLASGALFSRGLLVITNAKLLVVCPSPQSIHAITDLIRRRWAGFSSDSLTVILKVSQVGEGMGAEKF